MAVALQCTGKYHTINPYPCLKYVHHPLVSVKLRSLLQLFFMSLGARIFSAKIQYCSSMVHVGVVGCCNLSSSAIWERRKLFFFLYFCERNVVESLESNFSLNFNHQRRQVIYVSAPLQFSAVCDSFVVLEFLIINSAPIGRFFIACP